MVDRPLTRRLGSRLAALSAAGRIALLYAAARVVTTLCALASAALAPANGRHGPDPSLLDYIVGWDGAWYREIALNGYPATLPVDDAGVVQQNAWAFLPVFPSLARALAALVPGAGWGSEDVWAVADAWAVAAALVALVAGYAACLGLYHLFAPAVGSTRATWGVAFVAAGPLGFLFQVAYAESLFLALIVWALVALRAGRWGPLYVLVPAAAFTRPGELALALTLGAYGVWRFAIRRRRRLRAAEVGHTLALGAIGTAAGFAWPLVAALATGSGSAYFDTELAWRRGWVGAEASGFVPGEGWAQAAPIWAGLWGVPAWLLLGLAIAVAAATAIALFLPPARALGPEARLWCASYALYLVLVLFPQSSVIRLLLPLAPLAVLPAALPRAGRVAALCAGLAAQFWWIHAMYGWGNTFYLVP
ncbi:hypothetical protein [Microbacterium sp. ZXX196]|uniref:hypothetical protein n=1 Tax=Microbacterium sp. ZXX196 TaxID=2609291 RepID=UPI0034D24A39